MNDILIKENINNIRGYNTIIHYRLCAVCAIQNIFKISYPKHLTLIHFRSIIDKSNKLRE